MTSTEAAVTVAVVDYGIGNLTSVRGALKRAGAAVTVTDRREQLLGADGIVLPGVGAFGRGVENLEPVRSTLLEAVDREQPLLGICLGMQLLLTSSEEAPEATGLDIISGTNRRFSTDVKIPHMGWNELVVDRDHAVVDGVDRAFAYFVHSYYAVPTDDATRIASTDYDIRFPAIIAAPDSPVVGTQFHPEKSGAVGLQLLTNFVEWCDTRSERSS